MTPLFWPSDPFIQTQTGWEACWRLSGTWQLCHRRFFTTKRPDIISARAAATTELFPHDFHVEQIKLILREPPVTKREAVAG